MEECRPGRSVDGSSADIRRQQVFSGEDGPVSHHRSCICHCMRVHQISDINACKHAGPDCTRCVRCGITRQSSMLQYFRNSRSVIWDFMSSLPCLSSSCLPALLTARMQAVTAASEFFVLATELRIFYHFASLKFPSYSMMTQKLPQRYPYLQSPRGKGHEPQIFRASPDFQFSRLSIPIM